MSTISSTSPLTSVPHEQHAPSQKNCDCTSIWGRIISIPSTLSNYFNKLWQEHGPTLSPIAEKTVKTIGGGVILGLGVSILTGSPLIMIAMGAAGGAGYTIGTEVHNWKSKAKHA